MNAAFLPDGEPSRLHVHWGDVPCEDEEHKLEAIDGALATLLPLDIDAYRADQ